MAKFNLRAVRALVTSPLTTGRKPSGRTHEGGAGFGRDTRSELFLLAVSTMVGQDTFYETAGDRDDRYTELVRRAAVEHPEWTARLLRWLRSEANMRSASLVGAAEFVHARLAHAADQDTGGANGSVTGRSVVDSVLQRADEPGELLAYWHRTHGRRVPKPVKRGIADAAVRLYDERSLLKWDSSARGFRFADVVELTHPKARDEAQGALFEYALDARHGHDDGVPAALRTLTARAELMAVPVEDRRAALAEDPERVVARLRAAGMTWESLAGWLQGPMDAVAWSAIVPSMGYMALLRNLRNLDEAGVPDEVAARVAARLADPAQVARSRQFPYRFLAAYDTAPSLRWAQALDTALGHSLANLPALPGRSLVLVDTSASMTGTRGRSTFSPARAAAIFGVALAAKGEQVDLHGFATGVFEHPIARGGSVIREVDRFLRRIGEVGHGTDIAGAVRGAYRGHDRVFVISDMQTVAGHGGEDICKPVPARVPVYGFNLDGYRRAAMRTGSADRHEFGGLTDATFRMIPLLESGRSADWPF